MNRRQYLRTSRRLQVRFWTDSDPRPRAGFTTNISNTGMFVGTRHPVSVGAEVTIRTVSSPSLEIKARVARSVKVPPALQMVKQPGMGLHFLEKDAGTRLATELGLSEPLAPTGEEMDASPSPATNLEASRMVDQPAPADTRAAQDSSARSLQERRMLQRRVAQLEEKVGSLYADNRSLRHYSDLLESTRTELTAEVATLRTERDARPTAQAADAPPPTSPSDEKLDQAMLEIEALRTENARAGERNEELSRQVAQRENALSEAARREPEAGDKAELEAEIEQLRVRNADLANQLESALEFEPEPRPAVMPRTLGRPVLWGALAGVAILGFIVGVIMRPPRGPAVDDDAPRAAVPATPAGVTESFRGNSTAAGEAPEAPTSATAREGEDETTTTLDLPPRPVVPDIVAVTAAVEQWAAAWAAQDAATYLAAYSVDYAPPAGYDWDSWAAMRRERLAAPAWIEVQLERLAIEDNGLGRATARFEQTYATPSYRDRVRKTLELGWEEGAWRILRESGQPLG